MYLCHCLLPVHPLPSTIRRHLVLTPFLRKPHLERAQAQPKESTKQSTRETVISPAKLVMAMETHPLPGYHIRNSYWSKPGHWDQNNKTTINTERRDLSVTHRQSHTQIHYPCCVEQQSVLESNQSNNQLFLYECFRGKSITSYLQHAVYISGYISWLCAKS